MSFVHTLYGLTLLANNIQEPGNQGGEHGTTSRPAGNSPGEKNRLLGKICRVDNQES